MLDQFQNDKDLIQDDLLPEHHTRMSRKRLAYTLTGSAIALVLFLFLIGAFRQENEKQAISQINQPQLQYTAMSDLLDRVEKLEIQLEKLQPTQNTSARMHTAETQEQSPISDEALKQIITSQGCTYETANSQEKQTACATDRPTPEPTDRKELQLVPESRPSPKAQVGKTYVVQKGDTLSKISQHFYGSTKYSKEIYEANKNAIANMNQLKVGTKLVIPEK